MDLQPPYEESELVALLKQNDPSALNFLYDRYAPAIYTIVLQIVRDKEIANVLVQKAFKVIWCTIAQYEPPKGILFTWMLQIARKIAIDEIILSNDQETSSQTSITQDSKLHELETDIDDLGLKKVMANLAEEHKIVLQLCYYQGLTVKKMAEILSIPEATVRTKKMVALSELKKLLCKK